MPDTRHRHVWQAHEWARPLQHPGLLLQQLLQHLRLARPPTGELCEGQTGGAHGLRWPASSLGRVGSMGWLDLQLPRQVVYPQLF